MKLKLILALALGASLCSHAAETEEGFKSIFNGKDLTGWKGDTKLWSVKNGAIVGQTTKENPAAHNTFLIWTNGTLDDFELRLSYKIVANNDRSFGDSGIQYRSKEMPDFVVTGYQANLMVTKPLSGILYEERGRGIIHQLGQKVVIKADPDKPDKHKVEVVGSFGSSEEIQTTFKSDDWNDYVIIARGNHLQHFVNGKQTADVTDEDEVRSAKSGILALQLHAGPPMTVEFKNLRIKAEFQAIKSASSDRERMNGVWTVVSSEANGTALPAEDSVGLTVTIEGDKYTVTKGSVIDRGTFAVDTTRSPKRMDIRPNTGAGAGRLIPAIYEFDGDKLKVCYATADGTDRPAGFKTAPDSGQVMISYQRKPAK